jgi:nitroimidazol reductase NimA-like FMN-containing flavoprotein (pyridoxamine 5'-phosphate oxidase superfamily)
MSPPVDLSSMGTLDPPSIEGPAGGEMLDLDRSECLRLLAAGTFGRIAVNLGDGPPVIRPVNYVFDGPSRSVVFRTGPGSKMHALLRASLASFEIDGVDPRQRTGWSVIITGVTEEVNDEAAIERLDRLGLDPWAPGAKPHWIRIRAWNVSGRLIARPDGELPGPRAEQ